MKILQLMNRVPWPLNDGGSLGFYNYTKGYHDAGCEVTVAALNTVKHFVPHIPESLSSLATWHTTTIDNRVKLLGAALSLLKNESYNISRFYSKAFEQMIGNLLVENTYDVIVFESIFMAPYLDIVSKKSNALLVLRQHNVEWKIWETLSQQEVSKLKRWYLHKLAEQLKQYEQKMLNNFDVLVPITQNDIDKFIQMGLNIPYCISPAGIDTAKFSGYKNVNQHPIVFHLGSMEWLPNQDAMQWFLNCVWPKVLAEVPDAQCEIAGRGMPDTFFKTKFANTLVHGEVENAQEFMKDKSIMIVPLFSGSGIRIKILEGMAMGKAIVTTSLGVQGIACENRKHLLIADDADTFAAAVVSLLKDEGLRKKLSDNAAQQVAEVYDNNKVLIRLLNFYSQQITQKKYTHVI